MNRPASTPAQQVRKHCDFAYVIQGDDHARSVKVGRSASPRTRVAGIAAGVPFNATVVALLSDGTKREREMKALLARYRLRGEWFTPSLELNAYLDSARKNNAILKRVDIDQAFFDTYIQPSILNFINGRPIKYNDGGDFVARALHDGLPAVKDRLGSLLTACTNTFTPELLAGFVPLEMRDVTPQVALATAPQKDAAA